MDKAEKESSGTKARSRNILMLDVLSLTILFFLFMFFVRDKFASIFKEMNTVPTTLFYKILYEAHPIVLIAGFIIIIAMLILKERVIKNKTITYFINRIVLIALILFTLFFVLITFFMPLYSTPITLLK